MADLGAIAFVYRPADWYKSVHSFLGGIYSVSGVVAENSVAGISKVIAIDHETSKIVGITISNALGEFLIDGLNDNPVTIVGIDEEGNWGSDAISIKPKQITWSSLTQSGLNATTFADITITGLDTAELTSPSAFNIPITNFSHTQGSWYVEIDVDTLIGNLGVGLTDLGGLSTSLGSDPSNNDIGWYSDGTVVVGGIIIDTIFGYMTGDKVIIYYNASIGQVYFGKVSGGVYSYTGKPQIRENPIYTFDTGIAKHAAVNLVTVGDRVIFKTLGVTQDEKSFGFLPWDARDN